MMILSLIRGMGGLPAALALEEPEQKKKKKKFVFSGSFCRRSPYLMSRGAVLSDDLLKKNYSL